MTATSTKPEALLWIDVETTGPDRTTTAQILEIGMACTDVTATQDYGAFHSIVKPDILDINRITPWAWERHTANGLLAEVRAASTRQNGPAAVRQRRGGIPRIARTTIPARPHRHQRRLRPRVPRPPRHRHQPAQLPQTRPDHHQTPHRRPRRTRPLRDPPRRPTPRRGLHHQERHPRLPPLPRNHPTQGLRQMKRKGGRWTNQPHSSCSPRSSSHGFGGDHDGPAGPRK